MSRGAQVTRLANNICKLLIDAQIRQKSSDVSIINQPKFPWIGSGEVDCEGMCRKIHTTCIGVF